MIIETQMKSSESQFCHSPTTKDLRLRRQQHHISFIQSRKVKKRKEKLSNGELVKREGRKNKFLVFPLLSFLTADTDFLDKFKHVHLWQRGESQEISLVSTGLYLVSLVFLRPISAPGNSFSQFKISSKTNKIWRTNHLFDIWWCEYAILPK